MSATVCAATVSACVCAKSADPAGGVGVVGMGEGDGEGEGAP